TAEIPMSLLFGHKVSAKMAADMDKADKALQGVLQYAKTFCTKCKKRKKLKGNKLCTPCKIATSKQGPTWSIKRTQFPLRPANAHTAHTVQGKTFRSGCVVDLMTQNMPANYAYVLLSRVTKREDLLILRDFDMRILHRKPSKELLREEKRMDGLAAKTAARFAALYATHCRVFDETSQ